jgi:DNA-binding transcriptional MerR regulator
MTALTIQDVSRRSGLSEPTLRYYEQVGLIGPVRRDPSSGHRRYRPEDLDTLQALACLRAIHAERIEAQIETLHAHLDYLRAKAALWDAREAADGEAEAEANVRVRDLIPRLEEVVLR